MKTSYTKLNILIAIENSFLWIVTALLGPQQAVEAIIEGIRCWSLRQERRNLIVNQ